MWWQSALPYWKEEKERNQGSGSFTQVGREVSLRDWFRHSKWRPGVIFLFKALSCRKTSALTSRPTRLCDQSRRRYGCLLGSRVLALSLCFHIWEKLFPFLPDWLRWGDAFPRVSLDRSAAGCLGGLTSCSWCFLPKGSAGSLVRQQALWANEMLVPWIQ